MPRAISICPRRTVELPTDGPRDIPAGVDRDRELDRVDLLEVSDRVQVAFGAGGVGVDPGWTPLICKNLSTDTGSDWPAAPSRTQIFEYKPGCPSCGRRARRPCPMVSEVPTRSSQSRSRSASAEASKDRFSMATSRLAATQTSPFSYQLLSTSRPSQARVGGPRANRCRPAARSLDRPVHPPTPAPLEPGTARARSPNEQPVLIAQMTAVGAGGEGGKVPHHPNHQPPRP